MDEPLRIALSVKELGLSHAVITMVARDDLADGGADHLATIIREIRCQNPGVTIEVLTSDFQENFEALDRVLSERPEIFNHNIETVRRLTPRVRHKATYERTLSILKYVKSQKKCSFVKSGIMVGLGEEEEEVLITIRDLYLAGCDIITIGQYLQPNSRKLLVKSFVTPEQFKAYERFGHQLGVKYVYSGPFVRSSYNAASIKVALDADPICR
jgi:lipoyl synthase